MFKKIILAVDLSEESFSIVKSFEGLKIFGANDVVLVQCLGVDETASIALSYTTKVIESSLIRQKKVLEEMGYIVETKIISGIAKNEINQIAEKGNTLIVTGAEKHTRLTELFLGGLAYEVIHFAKKPVLLIRMKKTHENGTTSSKVVNSHFNHHILFPTDFSDTADRAFAVVKKMVESGVDKVTLVHVQDQHRMDPYLITKLDEFNRIDTERLVNLKNELLEIGNVEVDFVVRYGVPALEILSLIKETKTDLVVMGSQGRGFVRELYLGSVSHNVARQADSSVLLIPADDH